MSAARRTLAQLGGTTTWGDCRAALAHLAGARPLLDGPAIGRYETAFAREVGVAHAVSFAAGRVGLYGLLRALGVGAGDEVILQVPTHIVVANAIRYTGARPVYADCDPRSCNLDVTAVERAVTPRTRALVAQHTFGIPVDLDPVLAIAEHHGIDVIEDCVHALGATYRGRKIGSLGRAAFFSTEETKTISTTMGGMVVTDDAALAQRMRAFQRRCARPRAALVRRRLLKLIAYHVLTQPQLHRYARVVYDATGRHHPLPRPTTADEIAGERPERYEERLSNAQAAIGLRQLRRLDANVAHRRAVAAAYAQLLARHGVPAPAVPAGAQASPVRHPVWCRDRAAAMRVLAPHAVPGTWFTSVLEEAASPSHGGYEAGHCPRAEAVAAHLVNLPTHPRVRPDDVRRIVAALAPHVRG